MLTALLLLLLVFVLLLAVPLTITFSLLWNRGFSGNVKLGWANGRLHTEIPIQAGTDKDSSKRKRKDAKRTARPFGLSGRTLLRNKPFRDRAAGFLRDSWQAIEKRDLKLFLRIGLDDPADTGILWSVLGPLSAILATCRHSEISLQPEFLDPAFELESSGLIRVVPLRLLYLTARLLLSPTIWAGLYRARNR